MAQQDDTTPKKQRTATNPKTGQKYVFNEQTRTWDAQEAKANAQQFGTPQAGPETMGPKPPAGKPAHNVDPEIVEMEESRRKFFKEDLPEALPYVGAGAATALAGPEAGLPLYLALAFGGAGAGQMALDVGRDIKGGKVPNIGETATSAAVSGVTKGVVPEVAGKAIGKAAGALYKKTQIPQWIEDYLRARGVTLTAGELGGGAIGKIENVAGAVGVNTGIVDQFQLNRQDAFEGMLLDIQNKIISSDQYWGKTPQEWDLIVKDGHPRSPQEVAQIALDQMNSYRQMENLKISGAMGAGSMTPAEAGDIIIQSVRKTYDAAENSLDNLYEALKPQIKKGNYQTPWSSAGPEARRIFEAAEAAQKRGGSNLPPELLESLKTIAGIKDTKEGREYTLNMGSFDSAWAARRSYGRMIGRLEAQGVITREDFGVYKRIYQMMSKDMIKSLPANLGTQFVKAAAATEATKDRFSNELLRSMLRTDHPIAAEKVFTEVMRSGNETNLKSLLGIISGDQDAMRATRRSAAEWLFKNSVNDTQALKILEDRPGLRQLFGKDYDGLRAELAARIQRSITPQAKLEQKFLQRVTGIDDPDEIVARMLKSPVYADRMSQLTRNDPLVHQDLAVRTFQSLADKSTHNGPFGSIGSQFDPIQFAKNWQNNRNRFEKFLAPEVLKSIDQMSEAMSRMSFLPNSSVAAKFKTLQEVSAVTTGMAGAIWGAFSGDPVSILEKGMVGPAVIIYGPQAFIRAALSPKGARLLGEGVKIPVGSPEARAWSLRLLEYVGQQAIFGTGGGEGSRPFSEPYMLPARQQPGSQLQLQRGP